MKLFVWEGEGVLERYGYGKAIAFCETLEEARELVKEQIMKDYSWMPIGASGTLDEDDEAFMTVRLNFLKNQPKIYNQKTAIIMEGSW